MSAMASVKSAFSLGDRRPEAIDASRPARGGANVVQAEVRHVEYLGDQSVAYAALAGSEALVAARSAPGDALGAGMRVVLHLPPAHCHLFDGAGQAFPRTIVESN